MQMYDACIDIHNDSLIVVQVKHQALMLGAPFFLKQQKYSVPNVWLCDVMQMCSFVYRRKYDLQMAQYYMLYLNI